MKVKRDKIWDIVFVCLIGILLIVLGFVYASTDTGRSINGKVIASFDEATTKIECKQQAYEDIEYYQEKVPYQEKEEYLETVSGKNCDYATGCVCIHESWLGLGPCDSCRCKKERTVTKYKNEQKSRTVTKLVDVCIKLKKWQSPNYNENWLTYSELYDKNGKRVYL